VTAVLFLIAQGNNTWAIPICRRRGRVTRASVVEGGSEAAYLGEETPIATRNHQTGRVICFMGPRMGPIVKVR
jgi:hypothetical protein